MSASREKFQKHFQQQAFAEAQASFDELSEMEKQDVLAELFQKSEFQRAPIMVSVLRRELHADKNFDDFYQSWHPSPDMCNKITCHGQTFQQHFPLPVRVMTAVNMKNDKDVVSIGLSWVRNEQEKQQLFEYLKNAEQNEVKENEIRRERVEEVADGGLLGLFLIKTDENFGTPF